MYVSSLLCVFVNDFLLLSQIFLFMRYMTYIPVVPRGGLTERVVHDQLPKMNKSGDCSCTPQQGCFGMGDYSHNNNSSSSSDSLLYYM